jgi:hypothetical protein
LRTKEHASLRPRARRLVLKRVPTRTHRCQRKVIEFAVSSRFFPRAAGTDVDPRSEIPQRFFQQVLWRQVVCRAQPTIEGSFTERARSRFGSYNSRSRRKRRSPITAGIGMRRAARNAAEKLMHACSRSGEAFQYLQDRAFDGAISERARNHLYLTNNSEDSDVDSQRLRMDGI